MCVQKTSFVKHFPKYIKKENSIAKINPQKFPDFDSVFNLTEFWEDTKFRT